MSEKKYYSEKYIKDIIEAIREKRPSIANGKWPVASFANLILYIEDEHRLDEYFSGQMDTLEEGIIFGVPDWDAHISLPLPGYTSYAERNNVFKHANLYGIERASNVLNMCDELRDVAIQAPLSMESSSIVYYNSFNTNDQLEKIKISFPNRIIECGNENQYLSRVVIEVDSNSTTGTTIHNSFRMCPNLKEVYIRATDTSTETFVGCFEESFTNDFKIYVSSEAKVNLYKTNPDYGLTEYANHIEYGMAPID